MRKINIKAKYVDFSHDIYISYFASK
jgi:hypothetical protein